MDDKRLIQIVDAALAEAGKRAGEWIRCKPGCCECCLGVFEISALDARRLREGLRDLETRDAERARRVHARAAAAAVRLRTDFPVDPVSQALNDGAYDDEPCPVLDPATGTCDLYGSRPLACRIFGPAIRSGGAVGICELCYTGATDDEIAACAVEIDAEGLEAPLLQQLREEGVLVPTLVALALDK